MFCARLEIIFHIVHDPKLFVPEQKVISIYALSFYRSQNVLGLSKIVEPAQNFDCI